jgi:hypothetical protein
VLPGVQRVDAAFDGVSLPAYCDHWAAQGGKGRKRSWRWLTFQARSFQARSRAYPCPGCQVSNVVSREGFLETLEETLGFTPKVDFNAGVVAAGEAQIESTVTGNSPGSAISDFEAALRDQSQATR